MESWEVIRLGGKRIGYRRWRSYATTQQGQPVFISQSEEHTVIKRFGQSAKISTKMSAVEKPNGDLLEINFEMANPPSTSTTMSGKVVGNSLQIETTTAGRTRQLEMRWKTGIKSPLYQERLLREHPPAESLSSSYDVFMPEFNKIAKLKTVGDQMTSVKLHNGSTEKLLRVKSSSSLMPFITMTGYVNSQGEILKSESNLLGQKMVIDQVSREEAIKEIAGEELDLAVETLVKPDKPLVKSHRGSKVVYEIRLNNGNPVELLPQGDTQTIESIDDRTAKVTVVSLKNPDFVANKAFNEKKYLASNSFLQSDDARVMEHARKAAGATISTPRIMKSMESYVFKKLTKKNFSTAMASAAEVAKDLQGDCTEHSVLLAAMLRAKKIPSRIAVGLVYSDALQAFAGHMWTEAWVGGQWVPLDATLGQGGIGPAHIKLADSGFDDDAPAAATVFVPLMNLIGNMNVKVISEE